MKTTILKSFLFLAISAVIMSSCVNDDDYQTPELNCVEPNLAATKTMQEVFDMASASPLLYTEDDVIEAYVVSSDQSGNFFKTIHLQSAENDLGATILVDYANASTLYQVGRKVYIKLMDRHIQIKDGGLLIGQLDGSSIFRISQFNVTKTLQRSCVGMKTESELVQNITIDEAISSNDYLNMLVEFDMVQFKSSAVGQPYHNPANGNSGTNHALTDIDGNTIIVRSTSFSQYAANLVPEESGKVRGIVTRFGAIYQFTPRFESDIKLDQPRFYINTQLGGTALQFLGSRVETFDGFALNNRIFPGYINDAFVGGRYWEVKNFGGNNYIQMSSNASNEVNTVYFMVPVDFTTANTISFKSKDGFNNGNVLKVYYTTNYTPATDISAATLVDITSQFTIASGTATGYANNFTNSGNYSIPAAVTGNGFLIFEYSGTGIAPLRTTTIQLDDITIN